MITAEEFFRNKIKELHPNKEVVTLSQELITAEQGLRWANEFKQLHLHAIMGSFDHKNIERIRNSQSDAEARRYIGQHIQNLP